MSRPANWTEEERIEATITAQGRAADLERMLDQQLRMIRTMQERVNREMISIDGGSGEFADRQVVVKMTAITGMLEKAAKTKIDLAKAYEKLDQIMSPTKRINEMLKFMLGQEPRVRTDFLERLAKGHEDQKKLARNKMAPHTAVSKILETIQAERRGESGEHAWKEDPDE